MTSIDAYINQCDETYRERLQQLRQFIQKLVPDASEKISYGMPTFYLNGNLVHFALAKHHIGLYPAPSGIEFFADRFNEMGLQYSKGTLQLPLDKEIPWDLVEDIVVYRAAENRSKKKK